MESDDVRKMIKAGGVCGIVGIAIFLGVALVLEQLFWQNLGLSSTEQFLTTQGSPPYYQISIAAHLLVGIAMLCLLVAFIGLHQLLAREKHRISAAVGTVFGIVACPIMVIQGAVQGTIMVKMGKAFIAADDDLKRQSIVTLYRGLRLFDQGIDLAFDTFFFFGWIVLAFAMTSDKHFGKVLGSLGILLFGIAVIVNAWSAPLPPSFEMSPIVSLWVLAVYIQMLRAARSVPGVDEVRLNTRSVSS